MMKTKLKTKLILLLLLVNTSLVINSYAQKIPLVYDVENTGANFSKPVLPAFSELPIIVPLTDPFEWSDRSSRDTSFASWSHRRTEIKAEIEHYEIGSKPDRPDTITATYSGGILTVNVTENGKTLTLTSNIILPAGDGPFPAMIGMGGGTGSLPAEIFSSRKIAIIPFNFAQVMAWQQTRGNEPINKIYPDLIYMGAYSAWTWGVSRLIDGLELVQDVLPIDLKHLAVTGCSFAGKMALFAGAFDERIALTIPQESGGGGAAAWRVSQTLGAVEGLGSTSHVWFMESMFQFSVNVSKLPHDHHELMAMVAPRALFVIGNPSQVWLAEESGYVSCRAAKRVWETFGVSDRMGFSFVTDHPHCALPVSQYPELEAFVDKFLLGDTTANTNITTNLFENVDYASWTDWWGKENPIFPIRDTVVTESVWLEAECASHGKNWVLKKSLAASNNYYITAKSGLNSTSVAPSDSASHVYFPFTLTKDTTYYLFANLYAKDLNDDSFWLKFDDGPFQKVEGLIATGWHWLKLASAEMKAGNHIITIAYCEDGAYLDKICMSNNRLAPIFKGDAAINICDPMANGVSLIGEMNGYILEQNHPNPYNTKTTISFEIPGEAFVSLKVYNMLGAEIAELAGKEYSTGKHTVEFEAKNLTKGIYFYTMKADNFSKTEKMILQH